MVKASAVNFHVVLPTYHQRDGVYSMLAPWTQEPPPASSGSGPAEDIYANLVSTRTRLDDIFAKWGELSEFYGGEDRDEVLAAMNPLVGRAMALEEAGELFHLAHEAYVSEADTRGLDQVKRDNDSWAPGFVTRYETAENDDASMSREEFETKYGKDWSDLQAELNEERIPFATMAHHVSDKITEARETYTSTVDGIDLGELSNLRFENRNEAIEVAGSVEEVEQMIRESEFFADMDLTDEQITQLAEAVYREDGWDAEYVDAQGRGWVRGPDGRMVRAGSVMDPRLTEDLLAAMAADPDMRNIQLPIPPPDGVNPVDWTIGTVFNQGASATNDAISPHIEEAVNRRWLAGLLMAPGAVLSFGFAAKGAKETMAQETVLYPLMSSDDLQDRLDTNLAMAAIETGTNTAVGVGISYVSSLAAIPSGGASLVLGVIVDEITGQIVGYIIENVHESETTWSAEDVDEKSDSELIK